MGVKILNSTETAVTSLEFTTGYMDAAFRDPGKVLAEAVEELAEIDFDTFVVSGGSGLVLGQMIAHRMGKMLLVIRKDEDMESSHHGGRGYGQLGRRLVFWDDFVSSGRTFGRVRDGVGEILTTAAASVASNERYHRAVFADYKPNDLALDLDFTVEWVGWYEYSGNGYNDWAPSHRNPANDEPVKAVVRDDFVTEVWGQTEADRAEGKRLADQVASYTNQYLAELKGKQIASGTLSLPEGWQDSGYVTEGGIFATDGSKSDETPVIWQGWNSREPVTMMVTECDPKYVATVAGLT